MERKVILLMIDALGYETAGKRGGYLEHLLENGYLAKYRLRGGLPSLSRPMYETILTGQPVFRHGIVHNGVVRKSNCENLFSLTKRAGLTNAAAAYMWISELYNGRCPYDGLRDRYQLEEGDGDIQHGIFYSADDYPDSHLYMDANYLLETYLPDFMLIHPMNVDDQGHKCGCASREYQSAAEESLGYAALLCAKWYAACYDVIVTGDHGMDELGLHGGNDEVQRTVPLYILSDRVEPGLYEDVQIGHEAIAPLALTLLGLPVPETMRAAGAVRLRRQA